MNEARPAIESPGAPGAADQWEGIRYSDVKRIQDSREEVVDILRIRYGYTRQQAEVEISAYLARMVLELAHSGAE